MCRFLAYQGHPVLLADLLYRPRHSLVAQSVHAEHMSQPFNGDGFGVGWYPAELTPFPCVLRTIQPAWASQAFESLASTITTGRAFAHVRAASPGLAVQESNSHPFRHGRFMFMHNGTIKGFRQLRRRLQQSLSDWAWESIEGTTDSEHAFALFLDAVGEPEAERSADELREALVTVLRRLVALAAQARVTGTMACNFAVTDGHSTVVCRYARGLPEPASLYVSAGRHYECIDDDGDVLDAVSAPGGPHGVVVVASEPLTRHADDWALIPANHTLSIDAERRVTLQAIDVD